MYIRWTQLHVDFDLQRAWKNFPSDSGRYCARPFEQIPPRRTTTAGSFCIGLRRSAFTTTESVPGVWHSFDREPYTEGAAQGRTGRDESWRARNVAFREWAKLKSSVRPFRRTFATTPASWKFKETSPEQNIHRRGTSSKMAPPGAAREKFYFQFITTPTSDTPGTTLLLHFNNKRYLFGNVSEGTQRACIQRGIALKKVRHIFLTGHVKWRSTGGLIGMILTLADSQAAEREDDKLRAAFTAPTKTSRHSEALNEPKPSHSSGDGSLTIHGGDKLLHTMACARGFVFRKGMPVSINELEFSDNVNIVEPSWKDENIQVWAMSIAPTKREVPQSSDLTSSDSIDSSPEASPSTGTRKRSHEQFKQADEGIMALSAPDQHLRHQELRQKIVSDMFNSEWSRDTLVETSLADVKMPAVLFVRDPETRKITTYRGSHVGGEEPLPDIKVLVRNPWPGANIEDLPPARNIGFRPAMSYIVQGYPQRGKFNPKKAMALGVPKGPSFSSLTAGNSVTLENGTIVTPDMVLGPTKPGRGIAIVELPSKTFLANLVSRPEWTSEHIRSGIAAICWILGEGVAHQSLFKEFIESMPDVEHIISSMDVCPNYLALDSSAASAVRLSQISKSYFPVPHHDNVKVPQLYPKYRSKPKSLPDFTAADRGLKIEVEPAFLVSKDEVPPLLNTAEVVQNVPQAVQQYARLARKMVATETNEPNRPGSAGRGVASDFNPEIITLGTGSALPSKYRNVSATLLRTEEYGNFLFDCGENTLGQLRRVFDPPTLRHVLRNLRFIWLSHLHADHHLGTISVLNSQKVAFFEERRHQRETQIAGPLDPRQRVVVASGSKMLKFLEDYKSIETLENIQPLLCEPYQVPTMVGEKSTFLREQLGIQYIHTREVEHCLGAQAISLTFANGFKFSYSGDCRPSDQFAASGKGSDVLVHEATFDDDMLGDALAKKHSTTREALGVAAKMEAKNVILTHFSQRYQKLPVMENVKQRSPAEEISRNDAADSLVPLGNHAEPEAATADASTDSDMKPAVNRGTLLGMAGLDASVSHVPKRDMNVCVAFDYMRVRVSDIKHMQKFTPALAALFEAEKEKSVDQHATPQQKAKKFNHAKGSKKSQKGTDAEQKSFE
jgi:ribonuclease Z